MALIGQYNSLEVVKHASFGVFLDGGEHGEILLPKRYVEQPLEEGDTIEVFVYLDSEDRPIATTTKPKVQVGQFAFLQVKDTNRFGAFLDWGLEKDLMVPFAEQKAPMEPGKRYLVHVYLDAIDNRPTASSKIDKFLKEENRNQFSKNQAVNLIVANSTDLGRKAIINHSHWGLIHNSDFDGNLGFGDKTKGFIKQVRRDDKIDLCLTSAAETRDKNAEAILDLLARENGFVALHDKSDPALIKRLLGMSKGAFKKSIGNLYKQGKISLENNGIKLK